MSKKLVRLQEFRHKERLTPEEFAKKLGITVEQEKMWESGASFPADDELERISQILNCFPSYLTGDVDVNFPRKKTGIVESPAPSTTKATVSNTTTKRKALRCPVCGGIDLAFVTEYHKASGAAMMAKICKGFSIVALVAAAWDLFQQNTENIDSYLLVAILFGIGNLIFDAIKRSTESKTHVQAICKDCGHLWLLN